jgi:hypothetical protein
MRELAAGESGVVLAVVVVVVVVVVVTPNRFSTIDSERDRCCMPWYTMVDAEVSSSPTVDNRLARTLRCWFEETDDSDEADEDDEDDDETEEAGDLLAVAAAAAVLVAGRTSRLPLSSPRPAVRCEAPNNPMFDAILWR